MARVKRKAEDVYKITLTENEIRGLRSLLYGGVTQRALVALDLKNLGEQLTDKRIPYRAVCNSNADVSPKENL